jgi:calcineurin-like phosphoesterase family protein
MNTFLISDTHFGHVGVTQFLNGDGSKLRPWDNIEEMDEALVENWNRVVRPKDKVFHLGDVVINRRALPICARLNGEKILVKGNHDVFRLEEYTPYFKDILGAKQFDDYILTHIPVHPSQMSRFKGNIHGHLHNIVVMKEPDEYSWPIDGKEYIIEHIPDSRYTCVSVEQIDYTPIAWEELKKGIEG